MLRGTSTSTSTSEVPVRWQRMMACCLRDEVDIHVGSRACYSVGRGSSIYRPRATRRRRLRRVSTALTIGPYDCVPHGVDSPCVDIRTRTDPGGHARR